MFIVWLRFVNHLLNYLLTYVCILNFRPLDKRADAVARTSKCVPSRIVGAHERSSFLPYLITMPFFVLNFKLFSLANFGQFAYFNLYSSVKNSLLHHLLTNKSNPV